MTLKHSRQTAGEYTHTHKVRERKSKKKKEIKAASSVESRALNRFNDDNENRKQITFWQEQNQKQKRNQIL